MRRADAFHVGGAEVPDKPAMEGDLAQEVHHVLRVRKLELRDDVPLFGYEPEQVPREP